MGGCFLHRTVEKGFIRVPWAPEWQALYPLVPISELLPSDTPEDEKQPPLLLQRVTSPPNLDVELGQRDLGFPGARQLTLVVFFAAPSSVKHYLF